MSKTFAFSLHHFALLGFSLLRVRDNLTFVYEFQSFLSFVRKLLSFLSLESETLILDKNGLFLIVLVVFLS